MKLKITKNDENIVVIPQNYKSLDKPPTFVFRNPNSQDCLNFIYGGNNIFEAVCNCFLYFENKIELYDQNDKEIEYADYRAFINAGLSGEIAVIHNECMNAIYSKLITMINEAKETEKKSQLPTNSTKKEQEDKTTTQKD